MAENKTEKVTIPPASDRNMMAAFSYIWVISIFMILMKRGDEFIMFHAKQGLILAIMTFFWWIPVLGWILWVLAAVGMVMGFINAWQGKRLALPLVAEIAKKLPF